MAIIEGMSSDKHHSRRDFLQGKAAARSLADRVFDWAQQWVDSATELISDRFPTTPTIHLEASRRAMACEFAVRYHDVDRHLAGDMLDAFDEIERIEDLLTIYRPTSQVSEVNRWAATRPVSVDTELITLLQLAAKLYDETAGAVDITATPLSRVWGFLQRAGRLPSDEEISAGLEMVAMSDLVIDQATSTVRFQRAGMEINFNALGKGYALDRAAALLNERAGHDYLWHGGKSSVLARGKNRGDDHDCWSIGLRHPLEQNYRLAEFHLRDQALGTSGGATQFFDHERRRYSHVIDPRTGWPAAGVFTATVVAKSAAEADALSTAAFVLGPEEAANLCSRRPDIRMVLVCPADTEFGITVYTGNLTDEDWTPLCDARMLTTL